jgi:hypothetical protein
MHDRDTQHDRRTKDAHDGRDDANQTSACIHRVCITCNNMFETDVDHIDAKYCPACRRA